MMTPWLWLYRPQAPSARAQSIQVVHMAHAMARRGHPVTLFVEPVGSGPILDFYGLQAHPNLDLRVLPSSRTAASIAFRGQVAAWILRHRKGIVYARSKRYAAEALRLGARLVLEVHEVDSLQAAERGEDGSALHNLEARVLTGASAVVANAPGTLALLQGVHRVPRALVCQNGAAPGRPGQGRGQGIGYVGSVRDSKDLRTLARAAPRVGGVHLVGPEAADALVALSRGTLVVEGALPPYRVPERVSAFRTLVLPLSRGLFGEHLSSPLKLQDYLASGRPIVGADLPSLHAAAPGAFEPYAPGDVDSLVAALQRVERDEALRARLVAAARPRTWDQRAAEIDAFVEAL